MELFSFVHQFDQNKIPVGAHHDAENLNMKQFLYHDDEKYNQQMHDVPQYSYFLIDLLFWVR